MAGLLVAGTNPLYAGIYQFILVAMILAASGITGLVATLLIRTRAFSPAAQLVLRPGESLPLQSIPAHSRSAHQPGSATAM
jgi:putative ABC transport system permease protein